LKVFNCKNSLAVFIPLLAALDCESRFNAGYISVWDTFAY